MSDYENQSWKRTLGTIALTVLTPFAVKGANKLYQVGKAKLEDRLDEKNNGVKSNYSREGFTVDTNYSFLGNDFGVNYHYLDLQNLAESTETLHLFNNQLNITLSRVKKEVKISRGEWNDKVVEVKDLFEKIYSDLNLIKYYHRWQERKNIKLI